MKINFNQKDLPEIQKGKNGRDYYLDPIRKRLTLVTPEETVRQIILSHLIKVLEVPVEVIRVEESLSHYIPNIKGRADIIVHKFSEEGLIPICVIECKPINFFIGEKELKQLQYYANNLESDYIMISNGLETFSYYYNENLNIYEQINELPKYNDMLKHYKDVVVFPPFPNRISFEEIESYIKESREYGDFINIGKDTPINIAAAAFNLFECLIDKRYELKPKTYNIFKLTKDLGIKMCTFGNASGGSFSGHYRSYAIESNGINQIVSLSFSEYCSWDKQDIEKTSLNIGIDCNGKSHHSVQLVIDNNVKFIGNEISFYHSGRIAIGNIGSGKISELKDLISEIYPKILDKNNNIYLGRFNNDKLCKFENQDIEDLLENLISYALIRDIYRAKKKAVYKK